MRDLMCNLATDERGITVIEYGLIAALIAMAILAAVALLGTDLSVVFTSIASSL